MFELNKGRTFKAPVVIHSMTAEGAHRSGQIKATFRVVDTDELTEDHNEEKRLLDLVLVSVDELVIRDEAGEEILGDELLTAVKADPEVATALVRVYRERITRKNAGKT